MTTIAGAGESYPRRVNSVATAIRIALLLGGLLLAVWLVRAAGATRVADVLRESGPWIPLVTLLETLFIATDVVAARALLGASASHVGQATWVRSTALAYGSTILLPAGRAAGELTRAAALAPSVGTAHATATCSRLQACALAANAVFSFLGAMVLTMRGGETRLLALALAANGAVCGLIASVVFALLRSARAAAWVRRRFARWIERRAPADGAPPRRSTVVKAVAACLAGRLIQTLQYGVVVFAVGGSATPFDALIAQSIHLVGAAVGDAIPNQLGAVEGAYRAFAGALGLRGDLARALSVSLVVRVAQLGLAASSVLVGTLVARRGRVPER